MSSLSASQMTVVFGRKQHKLNSAPVTIDGRLYVALDVVSAVGADYVSHEKGRTVTITPSGGAPRDLPATLHGGRTLVQLNELAGALGTSPQWNSATGTLRLLPLVTGTRYVNGTLIIRATQPVQFKSRLFEGLKVFAIDVSPARLDSATREIAIGEGNVVKARVGQFSADTVRVAIDLEKPAKLKPAVAGNPNEIAVPIAPRPIAAARPSDKPQSAKPGQEAGARPAADSVPIEIKDVKIEAVDESKCKLTVATTGQAATRPFVLRDPDRLVIDFIGCRLAEGKAQDIAVSHPLVQAVRTGQFQDDPCITRVVVDLTKRVTFSIIQAEPEQVVVDIGSTARQGIKGATVVIDPGHGGSQSGAISPDGAHQEKDLNLAVSRRLSDLLHAAGASVVMTRYADTTLGLVDRPRLANDLGADVFVSLHCNSLGTPNKLSGVETYYHMSDVSCRELAVCVQSAVVAETGMTDRGVRSDRVVAPNSGFSVLRNAFVPAVLVEMGYLDHWADRKKLLDPEHQQKIAQGALKGIRTFLEGEEIGSSDQKTEVVPY